LSAIIYVSILSAPPFVFPYLLLTPAFSSLRDLNTLKFLHLYNSDGVVLKNIAAISVNMSKMLYLIKM